MFEGWVEAARPQLDYGAQVDMPERWTYLCHGEMEAAAEVIVAFARQPDISGGCVNVSERWMDESGEQMIGSPG